MSFTLIPFAIHASELLDELYESAENVAEHETSANEPENIQDNWNGLLFTPENQESFCEKLKLLIEDTNLRRKMGINARETIAKYSWDNAVANLVQVWQEQIMLKS